MQCLVCGNKAVCRGLCHNCYQAALRDIKKGNKTWKKLEEYKVALPPKHKKISEFRKVMEEMEQHGGICHYAPPQNISMKSSDLPGQRNLFVDNGDENNEVSYS